MKTTKMASPTQRFCGIQRTYPWFGHRFHIVNNYKTAMNTSLDNVYCSAKIKIA